MSAAADEVIVHHPDRLHEGVDDGGPAKFEAARLQILGYCFGEGGPGGNVAGAAGVIDDRAAVDEIPEIGRKASLLLQRQPGPRRGRRALDLRAVADDALVLHQRGKLAFVESRDLFRPKAGERGAKRLSFAQNGDPGQARLESVQHQFFEQGARAALRPAPFLVVIGDIERVDAAPGTSGHAVAVRNHVGVAPGNRIFVAGFFSRLRHFRFFPSGPATKCCLQGFVL